METERTCKVCTKTFTAHHRVRYCDECRQGIIDGSIPVDHQTRYRVRNPERFTMGNRRMRARNRKPKPPRKTTREQEARPDYQHAYYMRVTKPKRARAKHKPMNDYEVHTMQTIWLNKQIDK
jgi:hypothetical protein